MQLLGMQLWELIVSMRNVDDATIWGKQALDVHV